MNPAPPKDAYDASRTKLLKELKHGSPMIAGRYDPSGRFLVTSAQDSTLQRWDLATGKAMILKGHRSWVRGLAFHPKDHRLFSGDYAGQLLCRAPESPAGEIAWSVKAHDGWVRAVAVSPDGRFVATCGNDRLVQLWDAGDGKHVRSFKGHDSHVYNVAFHPSGSALASSDLMGTVRHWDVATAQSVRELDAKVLHKYDSTFSADIGGMRSMTFTADGKFLIGCGISEVSNAFAGVGKPLTLVYDWESGKLKESLKPKENFQGTGWGVVVHPATGHVIGVGGGSGGALWFWKPGEAQSFHTMKLPNNARDLTLHPDGTQLAVPFYDGVVRTYSLTAS